MCHFSIDRIEQAIRTQTKFAFLSQDNLRKAIALKDLSAAKEHLLNSCLRELSKNDFGKKEEPAATAADAQVKDEGGKIDLSPDVKEFLEFCLERYLSELVVRLPHFNCPEFCDFIASNPSLCSQDQQKNTKKTHTSSQ